MKIILIGFMGSGKSSLGEKLSEVLKIPIVDMDALVLEKTKMKNMHEVFAKGGETLLRETERAIAKEYASINHRVIATGGGVIVNKSILDDLKKPEGKIIFLNASFETIILRLAEDRSRPLFNNREEAKALYEFRQPLYLKYADQIIEVDQKSIEAIAQEVVDGK